MKGKNKQIWIDQGYQIVAENGFGTINIESMASAINFNKSSFYYYFGDLDTFESELLDSHIIRAKAFAKKAEQCQNIIPDMLNLFLAHKTDIFFHKQLRIQREKSHFKKCFLLVYQMFEDAILKEWAPFLQMEGHTFLASKILSLISENFLLQITEENFNYDWLKDYLLDISKLMMDMNRQSKK